MVRKNAQWVEVDLEKAEWRTPAERIKMCQRRIVPLSRQAVEILRELEPLTNGVFPARPNAPLRQNQMTAFRVWFHRADETDSVHHAGFAYSWLVTIYRFDDGSGRIAHAITGLESARSENIAQRFYRMSAQSRAGPSIIDSSSPGYESNRIACLADLNRAKPIYEPRFANNPLRHGRSAPG